MKSLRLLINFGGVELTIIGPFFFFLNCINQCNLIELGFKCGKYTWTNKIYRNRQSLILRKLDI